MSSAVYSALARSKLLRDVERAFRDATPLWVNDGIFQKTNGTVALGATSIDFDFINNGTVEVQTNTLRYNFNQQIAGLTLLDGGGLSAQAGGGGATAQPIQLLGGSLLGTGLVTVAFSN